MKALLLSPLPLNPVAATPNIIPIITDDLGYGDLSCHGRNNFSKPDIDK